MSEEIRKKIIEFLESKKDVKKKHYPKDIADSLSGQDAGLDRREVKKVIQDMATDGSLKYWSAGSTTYVMLPELFEDLVKED